MVVSGGGSRQRTEDRPWWSVDSWQGLIFIMWTLSPLSRPLLPLQVPHSDCFQINHILSSQSVTALTWAGHGACVSVDNTKSKLSWIDSREMVVVAVSVVLCSELSRQSCHVTRIWFYRIVKDLFWVADKRGDSICSDCSDLTNLTCISGLGVRTEWSRQFHLIQDQLYQKGES